jgi:ATP phosphoribosyltransferase regulatory subunit
MMNESLLRAGIEDVHIVLGHVGVFRSLLEGAQLDQSVERQLFEAVQRKAYDEIDQLLVSAVVDESLGQQLQALSRLSGDETVLERARKVFADAPSAVVDELDELIEIAEGVKRRLGAISLGFDLCELRGYEYHTGIVFAAYTPAYGRAVAKGGRYDDNGAAFGKARPASGFDSDLKILAKLSQKEFTLAPGILAPDTHDLALITLIEELRGSGEIVVTSLGDGDAEEAEMLALRCDRRLVKQDGSWKIV